METIRFYEPTSECPVLDELDADGGGVGVARKRPRDPSVCIGADVSAPNSKGKFPMKPQTHIMRIVLALALVIGSLGAASPALANIAHYDVRVDGLACPFCAYGLERS